jgi:hypothetical protein
LFARPERCPLYYYFKFDVVGAGVFSMCVGPVGGGRPIAVIHVGLLQNETIIERPSGNIVRASKVKKPTVRPKTAVGMDGVKKVKKTWMMQLQQGQLQRV